MKQTIHPAWFEDAKITCACGNTFTSGSTMQQIRVDICSKCHPLYTGTQKLVDTLGQVDKFQKRVETSKVKIEQRKEILANRASRVSTRNSDKPSLKDLLMKARKQSVS